MRKSLEDYVSIIEHATREKDEDLILFTLIEYSKRTQTRDFKHLLSELKEQGVDASIVKSKTAQALRVVDRTNSIMHVIKDIPLTEEDSSKTG